VQFLRAYRTSTRSVPFAARLLDLARSVPRRSGAVHTLVVEQDLGEQLESDADGEVLPERQGAGAEARPNAVRGWAHAVAQKK
jgi:hypothetical protein